MRPPRAEQPSAQFSVGAHLCATGMRCGIDEASLSRTSALPQWLHGVRSGLADAPADFLWERLWARLRYRRSAAVAPKGAPTGLIESRRFQRFRCFFVGAHPVRDRPARHIRSRTGCDLSARQPFFCGSAFGRDSRTMRYRRSAAVAPKCAPTVASQRSVRSRGRSIPPAAFPIAAAHRRSRPALCALAGCRLLASPGVPS